MNSPESTFPAAISAMSIAGSDPSGGAGLQADLKVFQELQVYGTSAISLLTVQNTRGVQRVEIMPVDLVRDQIRAVLEDIPPNAIKTGALGSAEMIEMVAEELGGVSAPLVVDPVLVSKHGHSLAGDEVSAAYLKFLFPKSLLITPNRFEAERLAGIEILDSESAQRAIQFLSDRGAPHVLLKAGSRDGQSQHFLGSAEGSVEIRTPRFENAATHGSGCVLAATVTALLARQEHSLPELVHRAVQMTLAAVNPSVRLGTGLSPADSRGLRERNHRFDTA